MRRDELHIDVKDFLESNSKGREIEFCYKLDEIDFSSDKLVYYEDILLLGSKAVSESSIKLIDKVVDNMSAKSEIAVLVKSSLLFDGRPIYTEFRQRLFTSGVISNVVQLCTDHVKAQKAIKNKQKYSFTSLLVLKKNSENTKFIEFCSEKDKDGVNQASVSIPIKQLDTANINLKASGTAISLRDFLEKNNYRLFPSYLMAKLYVAENFNTLSDYATVKQGCHASFLSNPDFDLSKSSKELVLYDVVQNQSVWCYVITPECIKQAGDPDKCDKFLLKKGDILFSVKNNKFNVAMAQDSISDKKVLPSSNFVILKAKNGISSSFVFQLLSSREFKSYIEDITKYQYYASLRIADILEAPAALQDKQGTDISDSINIEVQSSLESIDSCYSRISYELRRLDDIKNQFESSYKRSKSYNDINNSRLGE